MSRGALFSLILISACGVEPDGSLRVAVSLQFAGSGAIRLAVFGPEHTCDALRNPVPFEEALASSDPEANLFNSSGERVVSVSGVPTGEDRVVVAEVIDGAGGPDLIACEPGIRFLDGEITEVTLNLSPR